MLELFAEKGDEEEQGQLNDTSELQDKCEREHFCPLFLLLPFPSWRTRQIGTPQFRIE